MRQKIKQRFAHLRRQQIFFQSNIGCFILIILRRKSRLGKPFDSTDGLFMTVSKPSSP